ncbi:hypothetical protein GCM10007377_09640 [Galliscardovia ingluviei]|uniref:DUF2974 domain-containing protein n=1 Tax=Galliscardovia ingluviei TaxID=1769422 RepID=A0A8J3EYR8_9BIFI|nr:hypothetical protein GCM10007377_09640 [Galliscardovia ingluviei]
MQNSSREQFDSGKQRHRSSSAFQLPFSIFSNAPTKSSTNELQNSSPEKGTGSPDHNGSAQNVTSRSSRNATTPFAGRATLPDNNQSQHANILDYARTFTRSFDLSPLNEVDILVFAQLMYQRMPQCVPRISETCLRQETLRNRVAYATQLRSQHRASKAFNTLKNILFPQLEAVPLRTVSAALPHTDFAFDQGFAGVAGVDETEELLRTLAVNPRFMDVKIGAYVDILDSNQETQFAAAAFILPSAAQQNQRLLPLSTSATQTKPTLLIVFRGTDSSFIGWKEDFNMSFQYPVPAQEHAAQYINRLGNLYKRYALITAGHSKGGNLAVYAALHADTEIQQRISHVFSLDGPGFPKEVVTGPSYAAIEHKITKIVPETSIVGMIFDTPEQCKVVKSSESGIMQHLAFSWQIDAQALLQAQFPTNTAFGGISEADSATIDASTRSGVQQTTKNAKKHKVSTDTKERLQNRNQEPHFIFLPHVDSTSRFFSASLHEWLEQLPNTKREQVIDSMFSVLQASGVQSFMQLPSKLNKAIPHMLEAWQELSKDDKDHIIEAFTLFAQTAWQQRNVLQNTASHSDNSSSASSDNISGNSKAAATSNIMPHSDA